ncbi:cation diffusion facilitator family transporter [Pseudoalteromonas xiamenensis]
MPHAHHHGAHGHHHHDKLTYAVFINILLTIAQIVGGVLSGSLSLVADALHNLSDAGAIFIALLARKIANRPANETMTYGYQRAEIIGALINSTTLILIGAYLIFEAISKVFNPESIDGWIVVWIAALALIIDVITALLTYFSGAKTSMNIRAAFIHNVSDALASLVVIISGSLIILYQVYWVDIVATVLISLYVIYHGSLLAKESMNILMQAVPNHITLPEVVDFMKHTTEIKDVPHIHIWQLDEHKIMLDAQIILGNQPNIDLARLKLALKETFHISHATIEIVNSAEKLDTCYISAS